jgi:GT2 family glycosyltransferase
MILSTIIVTYNTREMTLDCLRALVSDAQSIEGHEILVVDNASSDQTVQAIQQNFPHVKIIANPKNLGFGAANNQALKQATGDFILLLNSDAFPKPGAIPTLIQELKANPNAGLIGPRLLNPDGTMQLSCYKFPSPGRAWAENLWLAAAFPKSALGDYRQWNHDEPRMVDWVIGACILLRREVYQQVGGFDERFFMYAEESDWQLRIKQAGWQIAFTPSAQVTHLAGASATGDSKPAPQARINPVFFNSLDYYERKHHGIAGLLSLRVAMILGCSMRFCLWLAAGLIPSRRTAAAQKRRLHAWLVWRQLTTAPPRL